MVQTVTHHVQRIDLILYIINNVINKMPEFEDTIVHEFAV